MASLYDSKHHCILLFDYLSGNFQDLSESPIVIYADIFLAGRSE